MAEWMTQKEFAELNGITPSAVNQAVKAGRLRWNGKTGRACRVMGPLVSVRPPAGSGGGSGDAGDLAEARLEKLRADIEVQKQKLEITERERRKEIGDIMLEEYHKAFAPMRARIVEMRLGAAKLAMLRKMAEEAAQAFDAAVRRRLDNGN